MTENENAAPRPQDNGDIGDRNVERLVEKAYRPETPEAEFVRRVRAGMHSEAALRRSRRRSAEPLHEALGGPMVRLSWRAAAWVAIAAAVLIGLGILVSDALKERSERELPWIAANVPSVPVPQPVETPRGAVGKEGLTAGPRPPATPDQPVAVGAWIGTKPGERRRFALADGSIVYVNGKTRLAVEADRRIRLDGGEVFVEVSARKPAAAGDIASGLGGQGSGQFVVRTPQRVVTAVGTKFAVRADNRQTNVLVTQGTVEVSGYSGLLHAGRQLSAGLEPASDKVAAIPRASCALEWTKDLAAAAQSPLVPESDYAGGALVALDPNGQEARLSLRRYHVDVHIEDGFARTTIDQTYFNHLHSRLEGTFYFPLPPDASISRLAMYVNGQLMEGGMAEREHARYVFEDIMYTRRDPALLEWVDGCTFKMRVFPLEGRQEKRIILSYAQKLPTLYGKTEYRLPGGHSMPLVNNWSFHARIIGGADLAWSCPTYDLRAAKDRGDLTLDARADKIMPTDDVVVQLDDKSPAEGGAEIIRASMAEHEGYRYYMLRYRPNLQVVASAERPRRDWVFLFESSGDRDPLLARAQIEIVRTILGNAEGGDRFAVLSAGTHVRTLAEAFQPVTPENAASAIAFLEKSHLVGALDLEGALRAADKFLREAENPYLVHVGGGSPVLGERATDKLVALVAKPAHYVGIGVGKRWGREFMKEAAGRTGGFFTQINPDEDVPWRAFDALSTLNTPRLLDVKVACEPTKCEFLLFGDALADGEELCAVARFDAKDPLPVAFTITGSLDGKPFTRKFTVPPAAPKADYLPRFWAKLEIDRLLSAGAEANKDKIVALSKAMYVMSPFTSLLVLENEQMYQQYKVDRGRKDHWAMYAAPEKIDVVTEPAGGPAAATTPGGQDSSKPTVEQVMSTILVRTPLRLFNWPGRSDYYGGQTYTVLQLYNGAYGYALPSHEIRNGRGGGGGGGSGRDVDEIWLPWLVDGDGLLGAGKFKTRGLDPGTLLVSGGEGRPLSRLEGDETWSRLRPWGKEDVGAKGRLPADVLERAKKLHVASSGKPPSEMSDRILAWRDMRGRESESGARLAGGLFASPGGARSTPAPPPPGFQPLAGTETKRLPPLDYGLFSYMELSKDKKEGLPSFILNVSGDDIDGWQDAGWVYERLAGGYGQRNVLYQRPAFTGDARCFSDLVAYAGGMNTTWDDVLAVVEAEAAADPADAPGQIAPAARQLIDKARRASWQAVTIPDQKGLADFTVVFDGTGRYAYQRVNSFGLKERAVCDGVVLYHLYEELGVGARRGMSRFHRRQLNALVPWALPPAEDLARGCEVRYAGDRTVVISPVGAESAKDAQGKPAVYGQVHLLFAPAGRLIERRTVEMPSGKVLYRQTYSAEGVVQWLDGEGKVLAERKLFLRPADPPALKVDSAGLVILPMPFRTRDAVVKAIGRQDNTYRSWSEEDALTMMASDFCQNSSDLFHIIAERFLGKDDKRVGLYTLLSPLGNWDVTRTMTFTSVIHRFDPRADFPRSPLAEYIAQQVDSNRTGNRDSFTSIGRESDGFIHRLGEFRQLYYGWWTGKINSATDADQRNVRQATLEFIRSCKSPQLGWAMLSAMINYSGDAQAMLSIAETARRLADVAGLSYFARYEAARCDYRAGSQAEAQTQFENLFNAAVKDGLVPAIDGDFRNALRGEEPDRFAALMRKAAGSLVDKGDRPGAVLLTWQCYSLGDQALAEELLHTAVAGAADQDRLPTALLAVEFLYSTGQYARADGLLEPLLADEKPAQDPALWRLAALLAEKRGRLASSLRRLEQALEIEYRRTPDVVNLQAVRRDYGALLSRYEQLTQAVVTLEGDMPKSLPARVVVAADRWRSLDVDPSAACQSAARILQALGARDLAWEYLTTPLAARPNEAGPWVALAKTLAQQGEFDLADRAYVSAFSAEGTNAQVLFDRACLLQQRGKGQEAKALFRQIADGTWPRQYASVQAQARQYLGTR